MKTQYITDTEGNKLSVIIPVEEYEKMLEELEKLEDIKAYDEAKGRKSDPVPFDQAVKELEKLRNG